MRTRKLILGLAAAALLSLSVAGAAYATSGAQTQGQYRGDGQVSAAGGNGVAANTTTSTTRDQLQTRDRLQDGTCETCLATGAPAVTAQGAPASDQTTGNHYGAPTTANSNGYGASAMTGDQLQTQDRLQDGSCGTCDGTCDGTGPGSVGGTGSQGQQRLHNGTCTQ